MSPYNPGLKTVGLKTLSLLCQKPIHLQPMHKSIEPTIARPVGIAQSEAVSAVLVQVELDGLACFVPRINDTKLPLEEKIIRGYHVEHGRSVGWYFHRTHAAIDGTDKSQVHRFGV